MPAFQLTRLKTQIGEMMRLYTRPVEFHRAIKDILEFYADHGYRAGREVQTPSFTNSYRIPPLVMKYLEMGLNEMSRENPVAGLVLADELWKDSFIEPRLIAAKLLGNMPLDLKMDVMGRIRLWAQPDLDEYSLNNLIKIGGMRLRSENDPVWLELLEKWLAEKTEENLKVGLRAMALTVQDEEFKNIPPLFRLIVPVLQDFPETFQGSILEVLECLSVRTPSETAYFIRQQALNPLTSKETMKLLRQTLPFFTSESRTLLRDVL